MEKQIELELNGTDGSVGNVLPTSKEKIIDSLREFPGCYYLVWDRNGNRSDTPLRSWRAIADAIAEAIIA